MKAFKAIIVIVSMIATFASSVQALGGLYILINWGDYKIEQFKIDEVVKKSKKTPTYYFVSNKEHSYIKVLPEETFKSPGNDILVLFYGDGFGSYVQGRNLRAIEYHDNFKRNAWVWVIAWFTLLLISIRGAFYLKKVG